jgi:NhaP-type Na+/H+ or K+/H+ antiporter
VYADLGPDVGKSLSVVSFIRPDIIFYALLPVPIFNTALHTDVNMFMREAWHALALAVIGLAVAATLTAVFAKYILPYGWSWTTALYFGAMCSANDPQAVIEKLKEGGVTSRLSVLIEGEGLLKDGTAIVLFSILFNASAGINDAGMDTLVTEVLRLTFGGMLLGLIIGAISASAVGYILEDPVAELTVTVVACFTAFLIGDATPLHVSGVVALITCGLYMSFYGRPRVSSSVQQPLTDFWGVLTYLANTLIFFIAGLVAVQQAYGTENRGVIPASDYGYLVALYLWVYCSRAVCILACYPMLRRSYGIDLKQLVTLWWCGLKGTLGVTLALLVQQNPNIGPDVGNQIMFHTCGLTALSLLINGSTVGLFLKWIGMDRAGGAEMNEVFTRACSAIEAKLEEVVEELKKDRFLGDSDWPMVWRYIPVMTERIYWHRIRYGSVLLTNDEEQYAESLSQQYADDDSKHGADGDSYEARYSYNNERYSGECYNLSVHSARRLFSRAADLATASRLSHLPPRLRGVWSRYHRSYRASGDSELRRYDESDRNLNTELGNEQYRSLDLTVHMPYRGGPTALDNNFGGHYNSGSGSGKIPQRLSRRSLDESSAHRLTTNSRQHSRLNSPEMPMLRSKAASPQQQQQQQLQFGDTSGTSSSALTQQQFIGIGYKHHSGSDLHDMLNRPDLALQGLQPPGVIGRSHTVHGDTSSSSNSFTAIGNTITVATAALQTSPSVPQQLSQHSSAIGTTTNTTGTASSSTAITPDRHSDIASQLLSSAFTKSSGGLHGIINMHSNNSATSTSTTATTTTNTNGITGAFSQAVALREVKSLKEGVSSAKDKLKAAEEELRIAERSAEKMMIDTSKSTSNSDANTQVRRRTRLLTSEAKELLSAAAAAAGSDNNNNNSSSVNSSTFARNNKEFMSAAAAAYSSSNNDGDSDATALQNTCNSEFTQYTTASEQQRRLSAYARDADALAEARVRFIAAVKANYVINMKMGWLTNSGLRVLQDNADEQLDNSSMPLQEWSRLRGAFTIPDYQLNIANTLRSAPFLGQIVGGWIFKRLAFIFELACNFILAHESIDILELLPEGRAADQLAHENMLQLDDASATLGQQLPAFPEVARSLKTQVSARFLLHKHRQVVKELMSNGFLNELECESLLHENTVFRTLLHDHPYAEHLPPRTVMLAKVPFLRHLHEEDMQKIVNDEACCSEELHGSNVQLIKHGDRSIQQGVNRGYQGWYYIVRGTVHMVTESVLKGRREQMLHAGAVFGMTDSMLNRAYRGTYTTASFVHLVFFDKLSLLSEAAVNDDLNRSLWRTVGVTVLRKFYGFNLQSLHELQKLVYSSEFIDLSQPGVGTDTSEMDLKVEQIRAKLSHANIARLADASNSSKGQLADLANRTAAAATTTTDSNGITTTTTSTTNTDDSGVIKLRKMERDVSGNYMKQTLSQMGLCRHDYDSQTSGNASSGGTAAQFGSNSALSGGSSMSNSSRPTTYSALKMVEVDANCYVLLVTGQLLPRPATDTRPSVEAHEAPCLLTDVEGRLVMTSNTKLFLIPLSAVTRQRHNYVTEPERALRRKVNVDGLKEHAVHRARVADIATQIDAANDSGGEGTRHMMVSDVNARQHLQQQHTLMAKRAVKQQYETQQLQSLFIDDSDVETHKQQRVTAPTSSLDAFQRTSTSTGHRQQQQQQQQQQHNSLFSSGLDKLSISSKPLLTAAAVDARDSRTLAHHEDTAKQQHQHALSLLSSSSRKSHRTKHSGSGSSHDSLSLLRDASALPAASSDMPSIQEEDKTPKAKASTVPATATATAAAAAAAPNVNSSTSSSNSTGDVI